MEYTGCVFALVGVHRFKEDQDIFPTERKNQALKRKTKEQRLRAADMTLTQSERLVWLVFQF